MPKQPLYPHVKGKKEYAAEEVILTPQQAKEVADFMRQLRAFLEEELRWRKEAQRVLDRLDEKYGGKYA